MNTLYLKFKLLPDADQYFKLPIAFKQLDAQAAKMSGSDDILTINNAGKNLFQAISAAMKKQAWDEKVLRQSKEVPINQTELEQSLNTQTQFTSFRPISALVYTTVLLQYIFRYYC